MRISVNIWGLIVKGIISQSSFKESIQQRRNRLSFFLSFLAKVAIVTNCRVPGLLWHCHITYEYIGLLLIFDWHHTMLACVPKIHACKQNSAWPVPHTVFFPLNFRWDIENADAVCIMEFSSIFIFYLFIY